MEWDALREQWQSRPHERLHPTRAAPVRKIWSQVRWRDLRESLIGIALMPFFALAAYSLWRDGLWLAAFFAVFLVMALVWIVWRLRRARMLIPRPEPHQSVRAFLRAERLALIAQRDLLLSASRWYSAPIAFGAIGLVASVRGFNADLLIYVFIVALISVGIEWLNRRAANEQFSGAIAAVEQQLEELEDE